MQDFRFYLGLGWEHIMDWGALDHLLFIAVLTAIYIITDWKQVLVLVTAFTLGHSLTLALSVLDIIRFNSNWVEFLIPCTILFTAVTNLFQRNFSKQSVRINYFLALVFGLIHGMGFANSIRFMMAEDGNLFNSILGFNIGLELGQIVVVTVLLLVAYAIIWGLQVNRRHWVIFVSVAGFGLALKMALERLPF